MARLDAFSSACFKSIKDRHPRLMSVCGLTFISILLRQQLPVFVVIIRSATTLGLLYLLTTPSSYTAVASLVKRRRIRRSAKLVRYVVDEPFSQFTELLRSLKVMADLNNVVGVNKVIGVTSSLPNEGKSTIAANFASMIAHAGSWVIIVDGDLRNPSLSRNLAPGAAVGLVEVAADRKAINDTVWTDFETGLTFLPVGPESAKLLHPNEVLASIAVKSLIEKLRAEFDYVIVDFPPLAPVVDTRTITSFIDSFI
jgi:succinoglycan biosynthesis transport protein ExoP